VNRCTSGESRHATFDDVAVPRQILEACANPGERKARLLGDLQVQALAVRLQAFENIHS